MPRSPARRLLVTPLESRLAPASVTSAGLDAPYAVGSRAGEAASATVYTAAGEVSFTVSPFADDFTGGVRTALADVTGDGTLDLIEAAGPGSTPAVEVYDGATQELVLSFDAYESSFTGGSYVAAADLTGDGRAEVITGAAEDGGPRVRVFDGASLVAGGTPETVADFLAIEDDNFRGGVRLAVGDIGGDGVADLLVGAGRGGGPRVAAFDGAALGDGQMVKLFADFFAYESSLRNGVFPGVGDLNNDGRGDLVFGAGPGGGPRVLALDGAAAQRGQQQEVANFFAGDSTSRAGVEVSVGTAADGSTCIVSTDLATGSTALFGTDGSSRGSRRGGRGSQSGGTVGSSSGYTADQAEALATTIVGTYSGSGAGLLTTLSDTAVDLSGVSADAAVTVAITSATAVLPADLADDADLSTVRLRGFTVAGTVTVTTDAGTLTLAVTGTLQLARGRSADTTAARGVLRLSTDRTDDGDTTNDVALGTGLALTASLTSDGLTVSRLLASDRTVDPGYIFQSPASRRGERIVLARAAATDDGTEDVTI